MGFDAQAFATAFLTDQAQTWKERWRKAEEESDRKKEIARTQGAAQYNKRKALASRYTDILKQLKSKGMTQENLALLSTNPNTLAQLYTSVGEFEQEHGRNIKATRLNGLITQSGDFSPDVDANGNKLTWQEQIKKSVGLYKDNYKPDDPDDEENFLQSIMGINAQERANQKLREQKEMGGFSTYDLYMMGSTGDYMPDNQASLVFNQSQLPDRQTYSENIGQVNAFETRLSSLAKAKHDALAKRIVATAQEHNIDIHLSRGEQGESSAGTKFNLDALIAKKLLTPEEKQMFETLSFIDEQTQNFQNKLDSTQLQNVARVIGPEAVLLFANQAYDGNVSAFEFNPEFRSVYGDHISGGINLLNNAKNAALTITTDDPVEQREIIKKAIDDGTLNTGDTIYYNTITTQELDPLDENTYNSFVDIDDDDENADGKTDTIPDKVTIELTEFSSIAKKSINEELTKSEKVQIVNLVNELTEEYNELPEAEKRKTKRHEYIKDKLASSGVASGVVDLALGAAGIRDRGNWNPDLRIPKIEDIE